MADYEKLHTYNWSNTLIHYFCIHNRPKPFIGWNLICRMDISFSRYHRQITRYPQRLWPLNFLDNTLFIFRILECYNCSCTSHRFSSHIILDILTTKGSPILYPISKTNFVVLKENRRIKTDTNQDKALFLVLIFLLIPVLFFTIQSIRIDKTPFDLSHAFATNGTNETNKPTSNPEYSMKNNPNLNIQLPKPVKNINETITIKKVDENETRIMINNT